MGAFASFVLQLPRRPSPVLALAGVFMGGLMAERVALFVDYQNAYMRARDAFHNPREASTLDAADRPSCVGALYH